jgi:apolipoprotein D and lipocalin family protein
MKFFLLILALFITLSFTQRCPTNVATMKPFNATAYLGRWYEIQTSFWSRRTFQRNCVCTSPKYGPVLENGRIKVDNTCNLRTPNGTLSQQVGEAWIPNPEEPGKLLVRFPVSPVDGDYWVIDTDYTNHAIVYACRNVLGLRFEVAWIISRRPQMSAEVKNRLRLKLKQETNFNIGSMDDTVQEGCKYPDN